MQASAIRKTTKRFLSNRNDRLLLISITAALAFLLLATNARAGGPRFISGTVGFNTPGSYMAFYTNTPLYYTDPGDLSVTVSSAQADAMVAAAATVWNIPQSSLTLAQGGKLAQHVSGANSYFNGSAVIFPADVEPSNYLAKPIAIVYDTDGSIIDLLLGGGASDPSSCRQNGVIESVDALAPASAIDHAVIVLNGRCIDSPTDRANQLLQMQYQLTRIFGRVLGLSWAQLNDSVFTGSPAPTASIMANWPLMHPIDILCGPYTYQCMQDPFTLRTDDISGLTLLYNGWYTSAPPAGKVNTTYQNVPFQGDYTFPTGQGVELVNLTMTRWLASTVTWEPNPVVSAVTGVQFQQNGGNPVSGPEPASLNAGSPAVAAEGSYFMHYVPVGPVFANLEMKTETINPLYSGDYAVGPYQRPVIAMPGPQQTTTLYTVGSGGYTYALNVALAGAPDTCNPGNDGTEAAPADADPSGWWSGLICGVGHASWFSTTVRANHLWTLEATALNATGQPTLNALQPVLGVWNASNLTGTLPTIAAAPFAMNSFSLGTTQLRVPAAASDTTVRLTVADQFGAGRPDFPYTGRILYADSVSPTSIPLAGDTITVTGMGFRKGNTVSVNGVAATVTSWSDTQIVALAPTQSAAGATVGTPVDILVTDPSTAATANIPAALTYANIADPRSVVITTPTAWLAAGASAQRTLSLTATDQGQPAATVPITWTPTSALTLTAAHTFTSASGTATVTVQTGPIAPNSTGTVTGCGWISICANWLVYGVDPSLWRITVTSGAAQTLPSGQTFTPVNLQVTDIVGHPLPGATVTVYQTAYAWQGTCTALTRCPAAPTLATSTTTAVSDTTGLITVTPLQPSATAYTLAIAASTGTAGFATTALTLQP